RGQVHQERGDFARALADWEQVLRLDPDHSWTCQQIAWLLATCPEAKYRNGRRALTYAARANELEERKDARALACLAAAHAECGEFEKAVYWQKKAVEHSGPEHKAFHRALLGLFEKHQPHREPPPDDKP